MYLSVRIEMGMDLNRTALVLLCIWMHVQYVKSYYLYHYKTYMRISIIVLCVS